MKAFKHILTKNTIGFKIFFSMVLLTISSMMLIVFIISSTYSESMRANEIQYNILATNTIQSKFDMSIELVQNTAEILVGNQPVRDIINTPSSETTQSVAGIVTNTLSMQPFLDHIHIIGNHQVHYSTKDAQYWPNLLADYELVEKQDAKKDGSGYWVTQGITISYIQPILALDTTAPKSFAILEINYDYLRELFMLSAIKLNEKVLVVNSIGEILFKYPHYTSFEPFLNNYPELLEQDFIQLEGDVYGIDSVIVEEKIQLADWRIIRVIQTSEITTQTNKVVHTLQLAVIALILICFGYSFWFTKGITKPIHALSNACVEAEQGNLAVRVQLTTNDEFTKLGKTFNMMLSHLQKNIDTEIADQKRKAEMQFQILQAQINPHFLYNTLDSIHWLATMKGINNIAEMSSSLIQLLKYNLSSSEATTTLQQELDSVKNYITIQKFRYSDNFDFHTQISPDVEQCEILKFLLQPLVENSIIHGFEEVEEGYIIQISAFAHNQQLHIQVIDNGAGMEEEQTQQLNENQTHPNRFSQIGVTNIRERIQLYFGTGYDVTYTSIPGSGTTAEMILPLKIRQQKASNPEGKPSA